MPMTSGRVGSGAQSGRRRPVASSDAQPHTVCPERPGWITADVAVNVRGFGLDRGVSAQQRVGDVSPPSMKY